MTDVLVNSGHPRSAPDAQTSAPTAHLTSRIAAGDPEAFGAFYEAWFERVFAMARGISRRDESFCLDVVQDCMMRVVKSMSAMRDEPAIGAWLSRAVYSATVDRSRSDRRRKVRERVVAEVSHESEEPDPMASLQGEEERSWLAVQIADLPDVDRALLLARFQGGLTLAQMGDRFGISGNAVHGRIRRALARLKQAAKEWTHDES